MASQTNVLSTHKANILTNGRTFQVSLSSTTASTAFDGSADISDIGVDGTLAVPNGGTGIDNSGHINAIIAGSSTATTGAFTTIQTQSGALFSTTQDGAATFGTLPVKQGGTGLTTATNKNAIITGNSTTADETFQAVQTKSGAFYATATDGAASFGTLPVPQGGTGITNSGNKNAIIAGNSSSNTGSFTTIRTGSGALYSTTQDGAATFGTLLVPQGGTGATSFTANCAILSGSTTTAALTTRAITNNTSATAVSASTNLITANTLYYHKGNSNIVTVGTISSGTWQGTTIGVGYGGTGKASWTAGGIVYASTTSALSQIADGTADKVLKCSGSGTYTWLAYTSSNTASTLVLRNSSGGFSAGALTFAGGTTSGNLTWKSSSIDASKANNNISSTQYPTTFNITDSADRIMARLEAIVYSGGPIRSYWYVRNYNTEGTQVAQKGIYMEMAKDGTLTYNVADNDKFRSAIEVLRYINSTDVTTWTADTLAATDSLAFMRGNVTGAQRTGHWVFLNVKTIGTPFQLAVHDSSELYIWKRYVTSGTTYSDWVKMNAGYADTAGSATTATTATSANILNAYASIGSSTTDHGVALKNWFSSNKSTAPRNSIISFYSSTSGNGSQYMGYFLSGYADNPYGGFFVCHYNNPYYVGISNGTYTQQHILTSTNYTSYTVTKTGGGASGKWGINITGHADGDLALSGGTMTGILTLKGSQYGGPSGAYAMNCNNSDLVGCNGIFMSDASESFSEGINFYRSSSTYDAMAANGGNFYFGSNVAFGASLTGNANIRCGLVYSTANSNTVTIGSQNNGFCHIYNSANIPFIFNKPVYVTEGNTIGAAGTQYRPYQIYLGRYTTADSRALNSGNPLIEFSNAGRDQYAQIVYTDYNNQGGSDSFTFVSNQSDLRVYAPKVHGAVWNDYAECRKTEDIEPGYCLMETETGIMKKCNKRMTPGCRIISDTYGMLIGETYEAKSPIAVSGRVLVYTKNDRNTYPLGAAVCAAEDGTIDLMTREEIINYPECIIGTVSEIPTYDVWYAGQYDEDTKRGRLEIPVNNRIWIYVR